MKVINIIQRYPPSVGGSETWAQEVCRYLARQGHEVKVLTLDVNREEEFWRDPADNDCTLALGRLDFDEGVAVRRYRRSLPIHMVHHLIYKNLLDRLFKLYFYGPHSAEMYGRMWREISWADVVFLHTIPYPHNYVAFVLAKLFGKKTIIVPHFHPDHPHYERRTNYWLMRNCDVVVTVTEYEKQYLKGKGIKEDRLYVAGNALHPEDYRPAGLEAFRERMAAEYGLRPEDRVVTFLGRKTPEKGVGHLIEATRALLEEMPLKLFLVGPRFDWYDELYASLTERERERIIDLGVVSQQDKVNLLHLTDLMALPSKYEAFGIVYLEAWICGAPVLGTNRGAVPSVIGEEGYLCKFADVTDIKAKLRAALRDREALRQMGARGKAKVFEHFTWGAIGRKAERAVRAAYRAGRQKRRVVVVANAYPPKFIGGAELIAHQQVKQLRRMGYEVVVFAGVRDNEGERHSVSVGTYEGVRVHRVCLHQEDYSYDHFNFYHERVHAAFERLVEDFAPEVVHVHNIVGLGASLIGAARRKGIRTVMTLHDYQGFCIKNTLVKNDNSVCTDFSKCASCFPVISGKRWRGVPVKMRSDYIAQQLRQVDAFISPSDYVAQTFTKSGIPESKIKVIWNGVDVRRFARVPRAKDTRRVRFSYIGYLGAHKGVPTIIEALKRLGNRKGVFVNFVGIGDDSVRYEEVLREAGWGDSVRFWGHVDNNRITDVFRETDVLILPSVWPENQPVTITEAMASRIPVIATRMGGIPELVEDGKTGHLYAAGDAEELATRMSEFVSDRSKLTQFGDNGHRKISEFTFAAQARKIAEVYEGEDNMAARTAAEPTVLCAGKDVRPDCAELINSLHNGRGTGWRFQLVDWLGEESATGAKLLWLVDRMATVKDALPAIKSGLPLLVPAENEDLKQLCVQGRCGLYYENADEALECLKYLAANEPVRQMMGRNSEQLLYLAAR